MRRNGLTRRVESLERRMGDPAVCPMCQGSLVVLLDDEDRYPAWYAPGHGCQGCGQDGFKAYRRSDWEGL